MFSATATTCQKSKRLSFTCFPVKLFRLVGSEKYKSLWWAGCGTHFIVNFPKFEQEILRNESIKDHDRFKTISFTSFVRQLNLYGFRKVNVNNHKHCDPKEWQRYAHAYFLRLRPDYLDRIKRQTGMGFSKPYKMSQFKTATVTNQAVARHLHRNGLMLSKKGPKLQTQASNSGNKHNQDQIFTDLPNISSSAAHSKATNLADIGPSTRFLPVNNLSGSPPMLYYPCQPMQEMHSFHNWNASCQSNIATAALHLIKPYGEMAPFTQNQVTRFRRNFWQEPTTVRSANDNLGSCETVGKVQDSSEYALETHQVLNGRLNNNHHSAEETSLFSEQLQQSQMCVEPILNNFAGTLPVHEISVNETIEIQSQSSSLCDSSIMWANELQNCEHEPELL